MVFVLGLAVAAYTIKSFNVASMRAEQDTGTMLALKEAKQALIAWSVTHQNWPGIMPFPDRLEATSPNYDGKSDCVTSGLNASHLIGKLPLLGDAPCISPQVGLGVEPLDSSGERLWYAVSANLIRTSGSAATPVINPSIVSAPVNQWLRVLDGNGNLISDRVAVVIIAPGRPLSGQNRSGATPSIDAFLDQVVIGATTYSNRNYDANDEDFIMGDTTSQTFNDRLVFITIDELMYALEKRAAAEAKQQLTNYYLASSVLPSARYYPYAADVNNACIENKFSGFLPIQPSMASCASAQTCTLSFPMTEVEFTLDLVENYEAKLGACSHYNNTCTCWGAGSCSKTSVPVRSFSCTANGSCTSAGATPDGKFTFTYTLKSPNAPNVSGACAGSYGSVICTGPGAFMSPVTNCLSPKKWLETLPLWFTSNHWQDYIYYEWSATSSLQSGGKTGISALLVGAGDIIATQSRPSSNVNDYLDTEENTDGDLIFEATNKQKTSNYNDQVFIVAP